MWLVTFVGTCLYPTMLLKYMHAFIKFAQMKDVFVCDILGVSNNLFKKLETKFSTHGVMDVFRIMYPQYCFNQIMRHLSRNTLR
jgi:hypothetical protein